MMDFNSTKITRIAATLCKTMGVDPPALNEGVIDELYGYIMASTGAEKIDRIIMFNPDAIGQWTYDKYYDKFEPVRKYAPFEIELLSVNPPKTPVCFGSMYTGASPEVHGIVKYKKPVIKIDSIFDAMIRAGKKPCIVAVKESSMSKIFNRRDMDYYLEEYDSSVVARTLELIKQDKHDFICVYNQEFDDVMHRSHPNSYAAQKALDHYASSFELIGKQVEESWRCHNTLLGFATDHGTHREWYLLGQHGKNIPVDMNIKHLYGVLARTGKPKPPSPEEENNDNADLTKREQRKAEKDAKKEAKSKAKEESESEVRLSARELRHQEKEALKEERKEAKLKAKENAKKEKEKAAKKGKNSSSKKTANSKSKNTKSTKSAAKKTNAKDKKTSSKKTASAAKKTTAAKKTAASKSPAKKSASTGKSSTANKKTTKSASSSKKK